MRLRTKLFLTWAGIMPLLWAPAFWSVQRTVQTRFDQMAQESFAGTRQGLAGMQKQRIARMRQAGRLVMSIPELRALIAEQNTELSAENFSSLQERLDNLQDLVGASFVAVLNSDQHCIAQSNRSPWPAIRALNDFSTSDRPASALVHRVFDQPNPQADADSSAQYGLWTYGQRVYQVLAVPLIFQADEAASAAPPEGALIFGVAISDESASELGKSHNCQITFVSGGAVVASTLPIKLRSELLDLQRSRLSADTSAPFVFDFQGATWHASIEPLQDPCSGSVVGQMLIQCDLQDAIFRSQVLRSLLLIMVAGLAAGAAASFLISAAVTRPVQRLASGVRRVADGDLDLALPVRSRDELGELSGSFNEMVNQLRSRRDLKRQMEEAQAASRAKGQFLANMSHEIRTPLNGVIGMSELLLGTHLTEQQQRYVNLLKTSAELLTTLINDILDFSKIEAGKLEIECIDFDLHATVEEVIDLLSERAARKKLELGCCFEPNVPRLMRGDPDRLRQILVNLVNNAIKFTATGSVVVRVVMHGSADDALTVRFSVTDTGIGIPPDRIDRLFKPFSQVDASTTREYGGTGLGLAISKQLAELMGGAVGVQSTPNQGSTFWFTIQLKPQPAGANAAKQKSPALLETPTFRVLAVDDSQTTRAILEQQLASWNLHAATAGSAADALGSLRTAAQQGQPFKLAIIDSDMPGTSGFELARAIKADAQLRPTVLMAMLPMEMVVDADKLQSAGFAGHLTKPPRQSQLFDSIMRAVARQHAAQGGPLQTKAYEQISPPPPPASGRRILIAEDNDVNQVVAVELLNRAGYQCEVVDNGHAAVAAAATGRFDLILMDCQMPRMDGFEATRIIRQKEQTDGTRHLPIIALTANAIRGDREQCLRAGMDDYCAKPINANQLLVAIHTLLADAPVNPTAQAVATCELSSASDATAPSDAAPQLPPILVDTLLEHCMNNLSTVGTVLEKFHQQTQRDVNRLQETIAARDIAAAARTAHGLKGAAAIVAADRVAQIAAELERLGREQDQHDLAAMEHQLSQLRDAARQCLDYLPKARALAQEKLSSNSKGL